MIAKQIVCFEVVIVLLSSNRLFDRTALEIKKLLLQTSILMNTCYGRTIYCILCSETISRLLQRL